MRVLAAVSVVVISMASGIPLAAHHTVANSFDITHTTAINGIVTEVEWKNPHVIYHLSVTSASGAVEDWTVESRNLQGMRRAGIAADTISAGDRVTMNVMVALDGSHRAATASVILPDGRPVYLCTVTNNRCP